MFAKFLIIGFTAVMSVSTAKSQSFGDLIKGAAKAVQRSSSESVGKQTTQESQDQERGVIRAVPLDTPMQQKPITKNTAKARDEAYAKEQDEKAKSNKDPLNNARTGMVKNYDELCQRIQNNETIKDYVASLQKYKATFSFIQGPLNGTGLDSKDKLISKWVSKTFSSTFQNDSTSSSSGVLRTNATEKLTSWIKTCAYENKDSYISMAFGEVENSSFWGEILRSKKDFDGASKSTKRTISPDGTISDSKSNSGKFYAPGIKNLNIADISNWSYDKNSGLYATFLALAFDGGEKILGSVGKEKIEEVNNLISNRQIEEKNKIEAANEYAKKLTAIFLNFDKYFTQILTQERKWCESDLTKVWQEEGSANLQRAKSAKTIKEQDEITRYGTQIKEQSNILGKATCYAKFYIEMEALHFETYMMVPTQTAVMEKAMSEKLTSESVAKLSSQFKMRHVDWLKSRINNQNNEMVNAVRAQKFLSFIDPIQNIYLNKPEFGCIKNKDKVQSYICE